MKKNFIFIMMILLPMVVSAEGVEINGIYYNLISKLKTAEVINNPDGYSGSITVPETISYQETTYLVTRISSDAFSRCKKLTSVTIPNSVTSIENHTFYDCKNLTSVTIPNSVTSIGQYVFYFCSSLTSITIPNSVTSIGESAFSGCSSLTSVTIPNSVTDIKMGAFSGCSSLTSITIPNSVTSIGYEVFEGCSNLTSVTIPNSVTSIEFGTFRYCSSLTSITIPNSVTVIRDVAFEGCSNLTSITIPNSVTSIGESAFSGCSSLTSVTIPNSVTDIKMDAFSSCSSLTSVTIPNSVTVIKRRAFSGCSNLTSITIPNSVTSIGDFAFSECPNLIDVTCYAEKVPSTESNTFENSYIEYATLHVPLSAINEYNTTEPWKNFKIIEAIEGGEAPVTQKCEKPTINYQNGKLTFCSETEGAEFISEITDADIKKYYDEEVQLSVTYNISVYAIKTGFENSETATATLCWIDKEPTKEGIVDRIVNVPSQAIMISNEGGLLTINGAGDGTQIEIYNLDGIQAGASESQNGSARVYTNLQPGNIAIVKIGKKSVKVVIR